MAEEEEPERTRLEDIKYYTSLFLGTLAICSLFAFLFLVPFILDPAISTMMHDFVEKPVHCKVTVYDLRYGLTNCTWSSCREGCTAEFFKCHQIRVSYTPKRLFENNTKAADIPDKEWAYLKRTEKPVDPETGEPSESLEYVVDDTPLLINIKGCGYPPTTVCDIYAEKYDNHSKAGETFPCHYSIRNPWIVMSYYNREETISSILNSIFIPNILFVLSTAVLVYWYCPYCEARCRNYQEQQNEEDSDVGAYSRS